MQPLSRETSHVVKMNTGIKNKKTIQYTTMQKHAHQIAILRKKRLVIREKFSGHLKSSISRGTNNNTSPKNFQILFCKIVEK